jgi:DNA repair ATPase RecN
MKAAGKDTSTLEAALAQFQKNIGLAKQKHETAAALLKAHAGFNANGQVTDRPAARETLKDTHAALSEARKLIAEALKAVKEAVKEFRQAKP